MVVLDYHHTIKRPSLSLSFSALRSIGITGDGIDANSLADQIEEGNMKAKANFKSRQKGAIPGMFTLTAYCGARHTK